MKEFLPLWASMAVLLDNPCMHPAGQASDAISCAWPPTIQINAGLLHHKRRLFVQPDTACNYPRRVDPRHACRTARTDMQQQKLNCATEAWGDCASCQRVPAQAVSPEHVCSRRRWRPRVPPTTATTATTAKSRKGWPTAVTRAGAMHRCDHGHPHRAMHGP